MLQSRKTLIRVTFTEVSFVRFFLAPPIEGMHISSVVSAQDKRFIELVVFMHKIMYAVGTTEYWPHMQNSDEKNWFNNIQKRKTADLHGRSNVIFGSGSNPIISKGIHLRSCSISAINFVYCSSKLLVVSSPPNERNDRSTDRRDVRSSDGTRNWKVGASSWDGNPTAKFTFSPSNRHYPSFGSWSNMY
jgi:hypothetical protein